MLRDTLRQSFRDGCLLLLGFCGALAAFGLRSPARSPATARRPRVTRVPGPDLRPSRN